jgi:hypothetical protein
MYKARLDSKTGKLYFTESRSGGAFVRAEMWEDAKTGAKVLLEPVKTYVTDPNDKRLQIPNPVLEALFTFGLRPVTKKRKRRSQRRGF